MTYAKVIFVCIAKDTDLVVYGVSMPHGIIRHMHNQMTREYAGSRKARAFGRKSGNTLNSLFFERPKRWKGDIERTLSL